MLNPIQLEESMWDRGMGMVLPEDRPTALLTLRAFAKATVRILYATFCHGRYLVDLGSPRHNLFRSISLASAFVL